MTARELVKDGATPYLLSIKQAKRSRIHLLSLIQKLRPYRQSFKIIFQPLPSGLPPDRGCPFHIDTETASPSSIVAIGYRMTPIEVRRNRLRHRSLIIKPKAGSNQVSTHTVVLFVEKKDGT